jgi:hypothetical protein
VGADRPGSGARRQLRSPVFGLLIESVSALVSRVIDLVRSLALKAIMAFDQHFVYCLPNADTIR